MTFKLKHIFILCAISFTIGYYTTDDYVKTEVKYVEKEVIVNRDIVKHIVKSDGTKITIIDKTNSSSIDKSLVYKQEISIKKKWQLGLESKIDGLSLTPDYSLSIYRNLSKNLSIGASYGSKNKISIGFRIRF
ncbi:hypothetical protein KAR91_24710 [Candidatus Pacearchaeota archaeon]|nr:hypothetical protein [Candidatus Pacearchaeota archaeon]